MVNKHPSPDPSLSKGGEEVPLSNYYWKYQDDNGNIHHHTSSFKQAVRDLRKNQTESEKTLWQVVRKKQIEGVRFNRQFPINGFVVDFYCRKKKLAIEVDGAVHQNSERKMQDTARQKLLESLGVSLLRFTNDEVLYQMDDVIEKIRSAIKSLP